MTTDRRERITEHVDLDLEAQVWRCNRCDRELGSASRGFKHGLLVRERDPQEIHRPLIDPDRYDHTFSPDGSWCRMLEYYCPGCAVMVEVEYLPPGHPISHDSFDVAWFRERAARRAAAESMPDA